MKQVKTCMLIFFIILFAILVDYKRFCDETFIRVDNIYPRTAVVTEINRVDDIVTVTDNVGYMWQFTEADDWEVGDIASMIMHDNGTSHITDDTIVSVRYNGSIN